MSVAHGLMRATCTASVTTKMALRDVFVKSLEITSLESRTRSGLAIDLSQSHGQMPAMHYLMKPTLIGAVAAGLLAASSCSDSSLEPRTAAVCNVLAIDNQIWLLRDPATVAMKFHKMQRNWYTWLRGTAVLYWSDATSASPWNMPTKFGNAAAAATRVIGDPHVENLGTFRAADGTMFVDWNDFDASGFAPYWVDVRRLALSVVVAVTPDEAALDVAFTRAISNAVATGYATQLQTLAGGDRSWFVTTGSDPLLDKLIDKAKRDGDAARRLEEVAPIVDGVRRMAFGEVEPPGSDGVIEDELVGVGVEAAASLPAVVAAWRTTVQPELNASAATIKGVRRRLGAGVSSYPALRYYVLLEGATASLDDDLLIEVRESRDGIAVVTPATLPSFGWNSNGERVATAQRQAQGELAGDPMLGWAALGPQSYRVVSRTGYQRGLNFDDVAVAAKGTDGRAAVLQLATTMGRLLARAHGQSLTASGAVGATVIAPLLRGREMEFADEVAAFVAAYAPRSRQDYRDAVELDLMQCTTGSFGVTQ
ncbi:MAG TPA: DUF2252 family protein [Kofleriaceae bacterium]|nr:DUF2252 family protein [Kofleriaceae bacterium]